MGRIRIALVKKLRRKGIVSHEAANVYLRSEYLAEHNRRFARVAARKEEYHRRAPRAAELDRIFRLETERTVSDDWVVRYGNRFFNSSRRGGTMRRRGAKCWCARDGTGPWRSKYRGGLLCLARDRRARQAAGSRYTGRQRAPARSDFSPETEMGTASKPSVASGGPPRGAEASLQVGRQRITPAVGLVLRFVLNAPPCGLRRAALRTRPTKQGMP
jgi:hypothetical protein